MARPKKIQEIKPEIIEVCEKEVCEACKIVENCKSCLWFEKDIMCYCTYYPKKTFIETDNYRCSKYTKI